MENHILPTRTYMTVFALLMVLLIATVAIAKIDLGPLNIVVALVIAVTKAALVVLYFMHVRYGTRLIWVWASLGFLWLILLFLTLGDYITRNWIRVPGF